MFTHKLTRLSPRIHARGYAVSVAPPKVFPGKKLPRTFGEKKSFQYNVCMNILQASPTNPLLFLMHTDFTAERLIKLRRDIINASNKAAAKPSLSSPVPAPIAEPKLVVVRTSILGAAIRDYAGIDEAGAEHLAKTITGPLAILSLPSFNPPQLDAIIRAMDRGVPPRKPKTPEELKKLEDEKNADPATPGRRMKRQRAVLQPELKVAGALIDGTVFLPGQVRDMSKLPTLDTLRAQIVGLLSAPSSQLAGILSQASGGQLARTLEGFKKGLEEEGESSSS